MSSQPLRNGMTKEDAYGRLYTQEALEVSDSKNAVAATDADADNEHKAKKLQSAARIVSWISVVFAFCSGATAIVYGQLEDSEALFGYGLDAVLDSFSSVAVLWRFYGSTSSSAAEARERKACIVIALLFFVSAVSLIWKSIKAVSKGDKDEEKRRIFIDTFSCVCGVVALVLATAKVYLGRKLSSRSLITDSIITFVGAAMSFLGVLSIELYRSDGNVWYLDAVIGLACGVFLFLFGLKLLIQMTCLYKNSSKKVEDEA